MPLHVEIAEADQATLTVVLVHGLAASTAMLDRQWAALRGRARLVRYDQRGHGHRGWADSASVSPRRLGRDLGRMIDE